VDSAYLGCTLPANKSATNRRNQAPKPDADTTASAALQRPGLPHEAEAPQPQSASVDLRGAKQDALRSYPPGHPYREALLHTPDTVPSQDAGMVLAALIRVLLAARHASWPRGYGAEAME
jgi:hypothetical protein